MHRKSLLPLMAVILSAAVVIWTNSAAAKSLQLQPVKMAVAQSDSVHIKGYKGNIELLSNVAVKDITVEVTQISPDNVSAEYKALLDEWQFQLRRDGNIVQVTVDGPTSKELWSQTLVSNVAPEFNLKITLPAIPVEVNWAEGKIFSQNHASTLKITQNKGEVQVIGGEGDLNIVNQDGAIKVKNRKGAVAIDSYLAKVELENLQGQVDLENFTGESKVEKIEGNLTLTSFRGSTKVAGVKGRLEFKSGNSTMNIADFQGELRGKSLQGPVTVEVLGEADVKLESQEGAVNLKLANSGAYVNLGTSEGSLWVPNFLKLTRLPNQQIRTGRLRGSNGGNIFVRTTTGDVRVR
jgi:hypothetical protein